jgi:hypothetical protein
MYRYLFIILFLHPLASISQQKVLLIGTHHKTARERLWEIVPVAAAVERFHPGIICVEYPIPTDTASVIHKSVMHKNDDQVFQKMEALRSAWKIPAGDMNIKIESLQRDVNLPHDVVKRMELQQLYFLSSDAGNADYQGYLIMKKIENDPEKIALLREHFPGFQAMKSTYEHRRYSNDEYYHLVFPLAAKLDITSLYPIDDLSTWSGYEKSSGRLKIRDTTDANKVKFRRHLKSFQKQLQSLPGDSNRWIFSNSPQVIHDLLYVAGYKIDEDVTDDEDIKGLQFHWAQRNKKMAQHIDAVARTHPHLNIVVFFGASHVGPVLAELNKLDKNYQVITLTDVISE